MEIAKQMINRALLVAFAALAALAALAAIIATDFPAPVSAQSEGAMLETTGEEQISGRIVARRLSTERIEFGWQPSGSEERILPRARYFPRAAAATVDRWLSSSPVEVEGVAIGRINARLRAGGRIEFAFTPTDGERILPPSRYFPHNATVDRWLRSTEITIPPPGSAGRPDRPQRLYRRERELSPHLRAPRERRDRVLGKQQPRADRRPSRQLQRRERRTAAQLRDPQRQRRDRVLGTKRVRADRPPCRELYRHQPEHRVHLRDSHKWRDHMLGKQRVQRLRADQRPNRPLYRRQRRL